MFYIKDHFYFIIRSDINAAINWLIFNLTWTKTALHIVA